MRFAQVEPTRLSVLAGLLGKTRRCVGRMSFGASGRTWSDCVRKPATDPARRFGLADGLAQESPGSATPAVLAWLHIATFAWRRAITRLYCVLHFASLGSRLQEIASRLIEDRPGPGRTFQELL